MTNRRLLGLLASQQADERLAKLAYDAYMVQRGDFTAPWDSLVCGEQDAWIAAARTIEAHVMSTYDPLAA